MYLMYTTTIIVFFIISYSLILLPLVIILKSNNRYLPILLKQLQTKDNLCSLFLIIFFILSGLPMTNTFLFKWLCLLNIFNSGNYYTSILFIFINIISILTYYNIFFNRALVILSSKSLIYRNFNIIDTYYIYTYLLLSIYFNIFGFFLLGTFIFLV